MTDEADGHRRIRFFSGISIATRIAGAVLIVSLFSLLISTIIGLNTGRDLGRDIYERQLSSLRASGNFNVTAYLNSLENSAESLALSPQAVAAVERLSSDLNELDSQQLDDLEERTEELAREYQQLYLDPLGEAGRTVDVREIVDDDNEGAIYLQSTYSINFEPLNRASAVDDARDGTSWSENHSLIHPAYRRIAKDLALSDLLLVDTTTGRIIYSVEKRPDLGASVDIGPVSGSIVSTVVDQIRDDPTQGAVAADFRGYVPALPTPVAAIGAGILDTNDDLVGAFVLLVDSSELTRILTAEEGWDEAGFPVGSDVYLLGEDGTTRSEPRGFLTSETDYLDAAEANGQLSEEDRAIVELSDSTVLTLRGTDSTLAAAEEGDTEVQTGSSIDGRNVVVAVEASRFDGFPLYITAEISSSDAQASLDDFEALLIVGVAIFIVVLAFLAVAWANSIVQPIRALSDRLAVGEERSDAPIEVPDRSPIEFHRLAIRFQAMAATLREQARRVSAARTERLDLMKRMLPSTVAQRLAEGDDQSLDEAPDASVVVLTFGGLEPLEERVANEEEGGSRARRDAIDTLIAELDELARHHGLEPIKIIGDEYYAACGHERPYIDHAPRAVAFATEAFDVVLEHDLDGGTVELAVGVASGPVTVGLTGTTRLVYDVWGTTVRRADQLARSAEAGTLLVSDETAEKLPETIPMREVPPVTGQNAWLIEHELAEDSP